MENISFGIGTPEERDAIIALGNLAFTNDTDSGSFEKLLPKLYGEGVNTARYHYVARADGKLVGMICAFPSEFSVLGRKISFCSIGTVSTHPDYRGKGIMQELFRIAVADMKRNGMVFSTLGGQRQRYEHFGYEPCGVQMNFHITRKNLSGLVNGAGRLTVVPLQRGDSRLAGAIRLHNAQPMHVVRTAENFYTTCISWNSAPYLLLENGEFRGYLVAPANGGVIPELELTDMRLLPDALTAWFAYSGKEEVSCPVPPHEREKAALLDSFCDWCAVEPPHSFLIFDYETLIRRLMALKMAGTPLANGRMVLEIKGSGNLAVSVAGQLVSVEKTGDPADLSLSRLEAPRFLFSQQSFLFSCPPEKTPLAASWFPLPLSLSRADEV